MPVAFMTTVTTSYVPLARVLMASVALHHPDSLRYVVVLDEHPEVDATIEGVTILRPTDLVDEAEFAILKTIYKPIELATALKPTLLLHALQTAEKAIFVDPDMRLFQPMTSALALLDEGTGTLLTPHRVSPPTYENRQFIEWTLKAFGTWNTGFVAATEQSRPLLEWWASRLKRDCLDDLEGFEWVDQNIIDLALGYFELDVFRDIAYNVGWWNFEERPLDRRDGTWFVGDTPLVLMHYSGVRPIRAHSGLPQLVHSPVNSIAKDERFVAQIRELENEYVADIFAAGYEKLAKVPYGYPSTSGGRVLTKADRRAYRTLVLEAEARGETPPNPDAMSWSVVPRIKRRVLVMKLPIALMKDAREMKYPSAVLRKLGRA